MGVGASVGVKAGVAAASAEELKTVVAGLSPEVKEKLRASLVASAPAPAKTLAGSAMGKWTDQESSDMIGAILSQKAKGPSPELFRKVRPFHLPDFKTKIAIGQDAPDGKVFELDGAETTLLGKMSAMGHGPGKLIVLNFGSYT